MSVNVPSEEAGKAIADFARQTGIVIVAPVTQLNGVKVPAIVGIFEPEDALGRLLANTGLEVSSYNGTIVVLRPKPESKRPAPAPARPAARPIPPAPHVVAAPPLVEGAELVVSARKWVEAVSETPVAVAAFSGPQLNEIGAHDLIDLQYQAAGVVVRRGNQGVSVGIRGVTTTDTTTKGEPGISFNDDGVPVTRPEEQALPLFDVQRVEILSGPQGTLYGKNSTGGTINVISNAPGGEFDAAAEAEAGNYGTRRLDLMVNVPLYDNLAVRAALSANHHDGYLSLLNSAGQTVGRADDEDDISGRLSALAHFGPDYSLRVTAAAAHIGGVGYGSTGAALDLSPNYTGQGTALGFINQFKGYTDDLYLRTNVQFDASHNGLHLVYLSAYDLYQANKLMPDYGSGANGQRLRIRNRYDSTYHELRISNDLPGSLEYLAGVNLGYEHIQENGHVWSVESPNVAAVGVNPDYVNVLGILNSTHHFDYSVFAHFVYSVLPNIHVSGGLRLAFDQTQRIGTLANGPFSSQGSAGPVPWPNATGGGCTALQDCIGVQDDGASSSGKMIYDVGADYQIAPTRLVYGNIATGYKPGGFNDYNPSTHKVDEYGAEQMTAYELGYKQQESDGFRVTSSFYFYDYSKAQVTQAIELNNNANELVVFTNLAPEIVYGWENDVSLPVLKSDVLNLSLNTERGYYVKFMAGPTTNINFNGKNIDDVPSLQGVAGWDHYWSISGVGSLKFHIDTIYSSSYFVNNLFKAVQYRQDGYTRTSFYISYSPAGKKYTFQIFANNLENREQIVDGAQRYSIGAPLSAVGFVSDPEVFGVRVQARY